VTAAPAVEAVELVKHFGQTRAVDGVSFVVPTGTVLGLLGPNGAGKTTLVRMLTTLSVPTGGTGRVAGYDILREPTQVRRSMGLTGQAATVDEILTGRENLKLIGALYGLPKRYVRDATERLFDRFDLTDAADRMAKTYSGGMRRRLDLAASLVGRPSVVFLDEPTTGLDPAKREDMWGVVRNLVADGSTVLLTTQYLEEADALADEITVIDQGRVIANDTPDGLKHIVGGQTLMVRPADATRLDEVEAIITGIAQAPVDRPNRGTVSVPVTGDAALAEAVYRLTDAGIAVTELSLMLPSLDQVFFSLTGRHTEAAAEPEEVLA
jgi:daunorubicin resistance ABC transporter ATP-binding subunit